MQEIIKTDTGIKIVEMQPVVQKEYTNEEIRNELEAVTSEIKNFDVICENRRTYLENRLVELNKYVAKSKGIEVDENIKN